MTSQLIEQYLGASAAETTALVLERIRRYVELETPSNHEHEIVRLAETIEAELQSIGGVVDRIDAPGRGRNLIVTFPGSDASLRPLLMLAHMDTVHELGTISARPFRVNDGRAEGPGVYDMKSGLALLVEAMSWHARRGKKLPRTARMLLTCDEEVGSHSSRQLIEKLAREAHAVLVPEPSLDDGGVKTTRKGVATYSVRTTGRAAHAGMEPGTAVSAITELVLQCVRIMEFADHARGTSINIGTINGGTATNVIAAEAVAGVDVRLAVDGEAERVHAAMLALQPIHPETQVHAALSEGRPPLVRTEAVARAYAQARECAASLGVDLPEGMSGGGSDGSFAGAVGAAVLDGLGPRGGGAHAIDEHILVADLPFRLALLCRLIERL
jgi:glutamate carboxypeptidase